MKLAIEMVMTVTLALSTGCRREQPAPPLPVLAQNAPSDNVVPMKAKELQAAVLPLIEQARRTYPDAKRRFLTGLPPGDAFFVVALVRDDRGKGEQLFIAVSTIANGRITGRIANEVLALSGYKVGDVYTFPESELRDWVISRKDGSEEGNLVGKFLDEWQKTHNAEK
jgi:hypothetical protein